MQQCYKYKRAIVDVVCCTLYHPDKIPPSQVIEAKHKLDKISHAYAILNNDQSRLLYHRYGIVDENGEYILRLLILGNNAAGNYDQGGGDASLLSSSNSSSVVGVENDEIVERRQQQFRLLELMGFPLQNNHRGGSYDQQQQQYSHQQRKDYLVGTITERLRPMVEGTISQDIFINDIYQECNILKSCPFGAHILRCIGRAYRIEGYRALRRSSMTASSESKSRHSLIGGDERSTPTTIITDGVIDAYRDVKKYASAAFAGVRLLITERGMRKLEDEEVRVRSRKRRQEQFRRRDDDNSGDSGSASDNANSNSDNDCDNNDSYLSCHDDNNHNNFNNEEQDDKSFEEVIQRIRRQKTHSALLSGHQMEALWKITKIELDRTVRDACRFVLCHYGDDYYLNHHPRTQHHPWSLSSSSSHHTHPSPIPISPPFDGWVSTKGEVVQLHVGKLRAAAAMILIGDIFVQSSKEGTSWK